MDNTQLNGGQGGDVIRDISKSGVKTQVVTLDLGGAGAEQLVSGTIPVTFPVASTDASFDTVSLLNNILKEMKLMSLHLASMTGEKFTMDDVQGD